MTDATDDTLVAASLAGDTGAFVELVKRHDRATRAAAHAAIGPNGPLDDALQEGLLKAYKSLASYRTGTNFRGWLCRVVRNAALDQARQMKRVTPMGDRTKFLQSPTPSIDNNIVNRLALRNAISTLPPKQREVLILIDVEGFDYGSAAEMLDIPVGTIASRLNSARGTLRIALAESHKDNVR